MNHEAVQVLTPYNNPNYKDHPPNFPPKYASAWGKDQYGIWFAISAHKITQRFRWIPKGQFTMGSLERVGWRMETLHEVTFTQGFWLADTTCTQELWQEVMRRNPSKFKDNSRNPVERVSWLDTQGFLAKLNQFIPNLKAHLPTEAQWEYACRAGMITPFSFGEDINMNMINYSGVASQYEKRTSPVKALPANLWGLYQMHGNVWEWCLDEYQKDLDEIPVFDPVNANFNSGIRTLKSSTNLENTPVYNSTMPDNADDGRVKRVLRGGSWNSDSEDCFSAFRSYDRAKNRGPTIGFRIALGH